MHKKAIYFFLGSSVTYGSTTHGVSFVDLLEERENCVCVKEAVNGTTLADRGSDSYPRRLKNRFSAKINPDHFFVQLSTNDMVQKLPLGEIADAYDPKAFDTSTTVGGTEFIIARIKETWKTEITFYVTPCAYKEYEALTEKLYLLQKKWDIGILDFYHYKDMDALTRETLASYMCDAVHPNEKGYRWMAEELRNYLRKKRRERVASHAEPADDSEPVASR